MKKKKILIISYSNLKTDPRVLRQIDFLSSYFIIFTAGISSSNHPAVTSHQQISSEYEINFHKLYPTVLRKFVTLSFVLPIYFLLWVRNYFNLVLIKDFESTYWSYHRKSTLKRLLTFDVDLVLANDIESLPLATKIKELKGAKVYFDAHEYSPLEYDNNPTWLRQKAPYYNFLCKKYIPRSDYNTTVSDGLAVEYTKLTGQGFDLVFNSPSFENIQPVNRGDGVIKFVHHGGAAADRKTDNLVKAFIQSKRLDIELHLILINFNSGYGSYIQKIASGAQNIFFHPPVPTKSIPRFINQFDVGIYFLPPLNFNQMYALPNKFFEFIQGRLMLAFGPSVEMEKYINKYQLGVIGKGFDVEDILECINGITVDDVVKYKKSVDAAAQKLSAENTMNNLGNKLIDLCAE